MEHPERDIAREIHASAKESRIQDGGAASNRGKFETIRAIGGGITKKGKRRRKARKGGKNQGEENKYFTYTKERERDTHARRKQGRGCDRSGKFQRNGTSRSVCMVVQPCLAKAAPQ